MGSIKGEREDCGDLAEVQYLCARRSVTYLQIYVESALHNVTWDTAVSIQNCRRWMNFICFPERLALNDFSLSKILVTAIQLTNVDRQYSADHNFQQYFLVSCVLSVCHPLGPATPVWHIYLVFHSLNKVQPAILFPISRYMLWQGHLNIVSGRQVCQAVKRNSRLVLAA